MISFLNQREIQLNEDGKKDFVKAPRKRSAPGTISGPPKAAPLKKSLTSFDSKPVDALLSEKPKPIFAKSDLGYHCSVCSYRTASKGHMESHFRFKHDSNAPR